MDEWDLGSRNPTEVYEVQLLPEVVVLQRSTQVTNYILNPPKYYMCDKDLLQQRLRSEGFGGGAQAELHGGSRQKKGKKPG